MMVGRHFMQIHPAHITATETKRADIMNNKTKQNELCSHMQRMYLNNTDANVKYITSK